MGDDACVEASRSDRFLAGLGEDLLRSLHLALEECADADEEEGGWTPEARGAQLLEGQFRVRAHSRDPPMAEEGPQKRRPGPKRGASIRHRGVGVGVL